MDIITKERHKKVRSLEEQLYFIGWFFLAAGSILIFLYLKFIVPSLAGTPCAIYRLFGVYCPGCGGTRAVIAFLQGHFLASLWYHPLVPYTIVLFGSFMLTQTLARLPISHIQGMKFHNWHLYGAVFILVLNFIIKNFLLLCFHITI